MNSSDIMKVSRDLRLWIQILFGISLLLGEVGLAQTLPPVVVGASQSNGSGEVTYHYQVSNHSTYAITSVIIGLGYYMQRPELVTPPTGWSISSGIPASSVTSPTGWTAQITTTEDTDLLQLEWSVTDPANAIPPGATVQGFSILLPQSDDTYSTSDWTVIVNGATTSYYTSTLIPATEPCDTPSIAVSLFPSVLWPPNHKLVQIAARVSVQDENYPNPTFQLVSITANENLNPGDIVAVFGTPAQTFKVASERKGTNKAGRVYTVTYSAINSCGNSATASKTIVVPHNQ